MKDAFDNYMGNEYREGELAYRQGVSKSQNPYPPMSEKGQAWSEGWNDEYQQAKSDC